MGVHGSVNGRFIMKPETSLDLVKVKRPSQEELQQWLWEAGEESSVDEDLSEATQYSVVATRNITTEYTPIERGWTFWTGGKYHGDGYESFLENITPHVEMFEAYGDVEDEYWMDRLVDGEMHSFGGQIRYFDRTGKDVTD